MPPILGRVLRLEEETSRLGRRSKLPKSLIAYLAEEEKVEGSQGLTGKECGFLELLLASCSARSRQKQCEAAFQPGLQLQ